MATGKSGSFTISGDKGTTMKILWSETYDTINNTSVVTVTDLQFKNTWWYGFTYYLSGTLSINGTTVVTFNSNLGGHMANNSNMDAFFSIITNDGFDAAPWGNVTVSHAADGTATCPIALNVRGWNVNESGANGFKVNGSSNVTLTAIDRAAPTVTCSVSEIAANSFKITATSSAAADEWSYSLDDGISGHDFTPTTTTSGSVTVDGLEPNTTYYVRVAVRKKSNHVYGESSSISVKTLGGAAINSCPTITADAATVTFKPNITVYDASYSYYLSIWNGSTEYLALSARTWSVGTADRTITLSQTERADLLDAMASLKSFTATIKVVTKSGSTQIGNTSSKTCTVQTTAANSGPTMTAFTYKDSRTNTTAITGNDQLFIQTYSYLYVTPGVATAKNGATIVKYAATCNGVTASNTTGAAINLNGIAKSGTLDVVVTATDSRGYTVSNTQQITVIPYAKPKVSSITLRRTNDIEAEMQLVFNGTISPITVDGTQKNSLKYVQYRYKLTSETSYGAYTNITSSVTQNGTSFSFSNLELCSLDANSSYDFHLYIRDQLNTLSPLSLYFTVPQGTPLVALRKKMVGINTPSPDAALHVVGDGHIVGDVRIEGTLTPDQIDYDFGDPPFYYGTCATAAATVAKVVTCSGFVLKTGAAIAVKFTNTNTGASPTLNVNSTGAKAIKQYGSTAANTYHWRAGEVVVFVYDGSYWEMVSKSTATTSYYGLTKLSSSTSSTSTVLAATASAVKAAYDRNSWDSISLTNALAIAYGGTGATTAAAARSNLGITATSLYSGTLSSGSITFNYGNYNFYVVTGRVTSSGSLLCSVIPKGLLTTSDVAYQFADESYFRAFKLKYSGSTVTLTVGNGYGSITSVYGIT